MAKANKWIKFPQEYTGEVGPVSWRYVGQEPGDFPAMQILLTNGKVLEIFDSTAYLYASANADKPPRRKMPLH